MPHLDDAEPITKEWLLSVGFSEVPSDMGPNYADHLQIEWLNVWEFNGTGEWLFNPYDRIEMRTRRQIRLLAELYNVKLLE
jgi:hypothetical protein